MRRSRAIYPILLTIAACGGGGDSEPEPSPAPQPSTYAQKMLGALERGDVERTRGDMLSIATALTGYASAVGEFPDADDYAQLVGRLAPTFIHRMPAGDAWGHPFVYRHLSGGWELIAPGDDGAAGSGDDIVLSDGGFTKLPDGYREH